MFKPVTSQVDFPKLERDLLEKWQKEGIVKKYLTKNSKSSKKFSFLDGPITANNPMGVHHAWGRTYKDFWQRFWNMKGYRQRFQNGFDEQGLWVEVEVEKELGLRNKKEIENLVEGNKFKSIEKFINLCKERVKKFSQVQADQSKRLGYFMDWDNSYHTSSDENNYAIWNFLKTVNDKGWLYKGRDSVPWCPRCGTAISQHEILTEEYKELTHKTVVFKLKIKGKKNEHLLAWTTTPWTIPGNVALTVDPNINYWKMQNKKGEIVILIDPSGTKDVQKDEMLVNKFNLTEGLKKVGEVKGKDLVGLEYEAPFDDFEAVKNELKNYTHRVVASDPLILPIDPAEGTGIVHTAPGAGGEDFKMGKKEKLPVIPEIDDAGLFLNGFDFLNGQHVKKASVLIIENLSSRGLIHKDFDYTHRYPTCWRCKTELVWRVVDEWYIAMDKKDKIATYREQMVGVAKKINWMPSWGLDRELDWLKNMHDWLISKKRYWGLSLPIWECQDCGNFEVIGSKEELKLKSVDGWDKFNGNSPHRPWIDDIKIKCTKCKKTISRIPDVGNPWLDAGIVPFSTMPSAWFPADFITEGFSGQFKNWFYSLIAMSTALKNTNPFKRVLGFGSVRDENGEEMHKSKGNSIEFNKAADEIGVDVMRWLYLRTNPEHNVNFGYKTVDEVRRKFHLLLWNIYNFFVAYAQIDKWEPARAKNQNSSNILDKWIISRLNRTIKVVNDSIEEYNAQNAALEMEKFVEDLSVWYVRRSRDRIGPSAQDLKDKNNCYETLYFVLVNFSKLLAPFAPFLAEEIYTNLTNEKSVHLSDWPEVDKEAINEKLELQMALGRKIVEVGHSIRKEQGIKTRQPLGLAWHHEPKEKITDVDVLHQVLQELNIEGWIHEDNLRKFIKTKGVITKEIDGFQVDLDTKITLDLKSKGEARDIVRKIQEERKTMGTRLDEKVNIVLPDWPKEFEEEIKRKALVIEIKKGSEFKVER
ncbi:MAG: isoleucine--tRNA ligase [Patescibacteria group bacterium]